MDYKEAANRIEEHMAIHHVQEYPHAQKITEALRLAVTVLRSIDALASLPPGGASNWDEVPLECPECGEPLECMYAISGKESYDGRTRRLYHCLKCLSNWSESTNEQTSETKFERYFFG